VAGRERGALVKRGSALACMIAMGSAAYAAEPRFAFVDLAKDLEETRDGKAAQVRLKAEFERKQRELDQRQESLRRQKEDLDRRAAILRPEVLTREQEKLQEQFIALQSTFTKLQRELAESQARATSPILQGLQVAAAQVGERNGFTAVFERSSAVWFPASVDITNEVIRRYDTGKKPAEH
jgi:outer membrane protein